MNRYENELTEDDINYEDINTKVSTLAELVGNIMFALINKKNVIIIENDIISLFSKSDINFINFFYHMISYWSEYKGIVFIIGDEVFNEEQSNFWLNN